MNRRLIDTMNECGLTFVRLHRMLGEYEVYEATHRVDHMAFGLYLLLPMTREQFVAISEHGAAYAAFEEQLLAPFYFRLKGDWGWNLYLYIILDEQDIRGISVERMGRIERAKKYGKKLIVSHEELTERLPAARIPSRVSGRTAADPYAEWAGILTPLGLDFCLNDYREAALDAYIKDGVAPQQQPAAVYSRTDIAQKPTGPIKSISFGTVYRPHLLSRAPEVDFAKVNMFYGPNGMGKTSVLECIELSFTGAIGRDLLAKAAEPEMWDGRLTFAGGDVFDGMPEEAERKEREIAYYKHKVPRNGRSQLNRVFHQYNYFSSEAVHQFCYNVDARSDYRKDFARVIYGEQLERIEQLWTQYRGEFVKRRNRLQERMAELSEEGDSIRNQTQQTSAFMKQRAASAVRNMTRWIASCQYAYPVVAEDAPVSEMDEWLQHLTPRIKQLELMSRPLYQHADIDDEAALQQAIQKNDAAHSDCLVRQEELTRELGKQPKLEELQLQLTAAKRHKASLATIGRRLTDLAAAIQKQPTLYEMSHLRVRRKELENRRNELLEVSLGLENMHAEYSLIANRQVTIASVEQAEKQRAVLQAAYEEAEREYRLAGERADDHSRRVGRLKRIASELRSSGRQYLQLQAEETRCPLCGHDHEDHALLATLVEQGLVTEDLALTELLNERETKRIATVQLEERINGLTEELKLLSRLIEAYDHLVSRKRELGLTVPKPFSPDAVRSAVSQLSDRAAVVRDERQLIDTEIGSLEANGFTLMALHEAEQLLQQEELPEFQKDETSGGRLLQAVERELDHSVKQLTVIGQQIADLEAQIRQIAQLTWGLKEQLAETEKQLNQQIKEKAQHDKMKEALASLRGHSIQLGETHSWTEWRQYVEQLLAEAEQLRQILEPTLLLEHNEQRLTGLTNELELLAEQKSRCESAIAALSRMTSLSEYGDVFVRGNFEAISRLFVALHAPNEFEALELTDDDELVARRKGQRSHCAIYQMSTGQRTAVTLAIFFVMHLVMDTAPQFLMLDEPVANMDELNVLGLLDFLRQLTVTRGTQLFFTTANPQVATLFRRKFSFFKHDFAAYYFQRYAEGPLRIELQQFIPQDERAVRTVSL